MSFNEKLRGIIEENREALEGKESARATVELLGADIVKYLAGSKTFKRMYDDVIDWIIGEETANSIGVKVTPFNEDISEMSKYELNKMINKGLAADVSLLVITNGVEIIVIAEHLFYEDGVKYLSTFEDEEEGKQLLSLVANGRYSNKEFLEYYKYNVNTDSVVDLLDIAKNEMVERIEEAKKLVAHLRNGGNSSELTSGFSGEADSDEDDSEDDEEYHLQNEVDDIEDDFDTAEDENDGFDDENVDDMGTVEPQDDTDVEEVDTDDKEVNAEEIEDEEAIMVDSADGEEENLDEEAEDEEDMTAEEEMLDLIADEATEYREITLSDYERHFDNGISIDSINALKVNGRKPFVMTGENGLAGETAECIEGILSLVHISKEAKLSKTEFERHEKVLRAGFDSNEDCVSVDTTPYRIHNDVDVKEAFDIIKFAAEALELELSKIVLTVHVTEAFADCPSVVKIERDDEEDSLEFSEFLKVIETDKDIIRRIPARKPCVEYLESIVKRVISIKFGSITDRMIENQTDKAQSIWDIIVNSQGGEENAVLPKRPFKIFGSNKKIISDVVAEVRDSYETITINGIDYYVSHLNDFEYLFAISSIVNGIIEKSNGEMKINTEIDSGLLEALRGYESTDAREALLLRRIVGYFSDLEQNN